MKTRSRISIFAVLLATSIAHSALADETLQGTWKVTSAKRAGVEDDDPVGDKVTFKGDSMTVMIADRDDSPKKMQIKTDTSKSPNEIDITETKEDVATTVLGVFEVSEDSLRMCLARPGSARPAKLESQPETKQFSLVLKRVTNE